MQATLTAVVSFALVASSLAVTDEEREAAFKKDVWPILEASCIECHGKNPAKKPKGGFNAMTLKNILEGYGKPSNRKPAIVWGDAAKSKIYTTAVLGSKNSEDEEAMPPMEQKNRKPLTEAQLAILKAFIEAK